MKFCGNCGAKNDDDAVICGECGCKIDEAAETPSARAAGEKFSALRKFRSLILNCIVLAVSLLVIINGFVGGFKVRYYYINYHGDGVEPQYIDINQNMYQAMDAWFTSMKDEASYGAFYEYRDHGGEPNKVIREYYETDEKIERIFENVFMDSWVYELSDKAKAKLSEELSKINILKYDLLSEEAYDSGAEFTRMPEITCIFAVAMLPVSIASAIVSLIFAILSALNLARKRDSKYNTSISVPLILMGVAVYMLSVGGFIPSGLTVAAVVIAVAGVAAVSTLTALTSDNFDWHRTTLYGVATALSLVIMLVSIFFGGRAVEVFNVRDRYGDVSEIGMFSVFSPLVPVMYGLSCGSFAAGFAGLMGENKLRKIKQLTIAGVVISGVSLVYTFILSGGVSSAFSASTIVSVLLSVALLVFVCVFKADKAPSATHNQ